MPIYVYKAITRSGKKVKGELDLPNIDMAYTVLQRKGYSKIKVKLKPKDLLEGTFLEGKVKDRDKVVFSRQFATMISAGVPILQALQVLCEQTENKKFRRVLYEVKNDVEGGSSLYEAMRKHKDVFDDLYVNMINAGETGGVLDTVLQRLAEYIEKAASLKSKVKGAMIYPGVICFVAVAVVTVILVYVIPTFEKLFEEAGSALPALTQIVINLSHWVKSNILYMFLTGIGLFVLYKILYRFDRTRTVLDSMKLKIPLFGNLLKKVAIARFSRTLSTMISSGVPILQSLEIVAKTSGNKVLELGIMEVKKGVAEGQPIAQPLEDIGIFPPLVIHMVSIGEASGALDTMLAKVADFYDEEVEIAVETLMSLIEPVMIVFLGVVVGGLVISMYLPIFKLAGAITG